MAQRSNGEGTYRQRANGSWEGRLAWRDETSGELRRRSVYGKTRAECRAKLDELRGRLDDGAPAVDARGTVTAAVKAYIAGPLAAAELAPSTRSLYATLLSKHVEPRLGHKQLADVKPSDVEHVLAAMRDAGSSGSTRRSTYAAMRGMWAAAVRDGAVRRSPVESVRRPAAAGAPVPAVRGEQLQQLRQAVAGDRVLEPLVELMLSTGLRRGEALGLRWDDVDMAGGVAVVSRQLVRDAGAGLVLRDVKTAKGRRAVPLTAGVVEQLRAHKRRQAAEQLRAGSSWAGTGLVFTTQAGGALDPRNVSRWHAEACRRAGVDAAASGLHALRHSAATAMLEAGAPVRVVADVLGHSSAVITLDVYQDVDAAGLRAAVELGESRTASPVG